MEILSFSSVLSDFWAGINWEYLARLLVAAILGTLVGLEREYRAKDAGYRTHFLVCVGSALMMLVSKYGFEDVLGNDGMRLDPARIAAQVVSGIGFIGAGTIILQKQVVKGLTTAAGLWAIAGVGLAAGAGMYKAAIAATILILIGLELLRVFFKGVGYRNISLEIHVHDKKNLDELSRLLSHQDYLVKAYHVEQLQVGYKVEAAISLKNKQAKEALFSKLNGIDQITLTKLD